MYNYRSPDSWQMYGSELLKSLAKARWDVNHGGI